MSTQTQYPVHRYGKQIPWEIPVQLPLGDFLRPGDCALDVGANIGGLSIAMSRMVGPSGQVHAFEANPRLFSRLRNDLEANGAGNVTLVPKAVWSHSGEVLPFYCDDSYYGVGSGLFVNQPNWQQVEVETICLDDYCEAMRIAPVAMKLDVEGAELQVVRGAESTLRRAAPVVVFEYVASRATSDDEDVAASLRRLDYTLFDANLYRPVTRRWYLEQFETAVLVNVIAVPNSILRSSPFGDVRVRKLTGFNCPRGALKSRQIQLPSAGRYRIAVDFDGPEDAPMALRLIDEQNNALAYYEATVAHLRPHTYSNLVFQTTEPRTVYVEITPRGNANVEMRGVEVAEICLQNS